MIGGSGEDGGSTSVEHGRTLEFRLLIKGFGSGWRCLEAWVAWQDKVEERKPKLFQWTKMMEESQTRS